MALEKIISGGQTGVDRAALDAALAGDFPCGGWAPLGVDVALSGFEFLVAFLQAYVFTILTCIYLKDALHPSH